MLLWILLVIILMWWEIPLKTDTKIIPQNIEWMSNNYNK